MKIYGLIGLLIAGIFQIGDQIAEAETIRMGYFEIKPHKYTSETTGLPAGATVTFFERVARKMGCDVAWVGPLPHARLVLYLETRENFLYYPENSFYLAQPNFVVKRNNPLTRINSAEDVKGYVVGQFSKAANSKFVSENESLFKFEIISSGGYTFNQHLKKLFAGRVDAIHTLDEFSLLYEAKKLNMDAQIRILYLPEPPLPFFSVFCKNEKGKILAHKYDIAIKELGFTSNHYIELIQHEFDLLNKDKHVQGAD